MGLCASKARTYSSSNDYLNELLAKKIEEGLKYKLHGKFVEALKCFDEAIEIDPNSELAHVGRWDVFRLQENMTDAFRERNILSKINPNSLAVKSSLANSKFKEDRNSEALEKVRDQILKAKPKDFEECRLQADLYSERGNIKMQISKLKEALKFKPDIEVYYDLGQIYDKQQDYEAAEASFLASIELDDEWGDSWLGLGIVYYKQGYYEKALEAHNKAVELAPNDILILFNRIDDYIALDRRDEANKDFILGKKLLENPANCAELSKGQMSFIESLLELATIDLTGIKEQISGTDRTSIALKKEVEEIDEQRNELFSKRSSLLVRNQNLDQSEMAFFIAQMKAMQEKIASLEAQIAKKADASAVSAAIRTNAEEELIYSLTTKIKSNTSLRKYDEAFKFTMNASFTSSASVVCGELSVDTSNISVSAASTLASLIPFAGEVVGKIVQTAGDFVISRNIKKNAAIFARIASDPGTFSDLVLHLSARVTLHPTKMQEIRCINISTKPEGWWNGLFENLGSVKENVMQQLEGENYYSTPEAKLAHQDATTLIKGIIKKIANHEILTPLTSESDFSCECMQILGLNTEIQIDYTDS